MNIRWYINRLKVMGVKEITHRLIEAVQLRSMFFRRRAYAKKFAVEKYNNIEFSFCGAANPCLTDYPFSEAEINDIELLRGVWPALGFAWRWEDSRKDWLQAPDTGRLWSSDFFTQISYREGNDVGDIRVLWEPARLQQLIIYAKLAVRSGESENRGNWIALLRKMLISFYDQNPPYQGPHYVSAMECSLRMVAVLHAIDLLRPYIGRDDALWSLVVSLVHSHAYFIVRRLSLHSSAGNHTVAECVGLLYAGLLFPELEGSKKWVSTALPLLEYEVGRQILPDGGGIEQASWYHLLTTDLALLAANVLSRYHRQSAAIESAVMRARQYLRQCSNGDMRMFPLIGDSDSGYALMPGTALAIQWKRGSEPVDGPGKVTFGDTGMSFLRGANSQQLIFKHGSLGMAPSFGHGHADALSVILSVKNRSICVDTGTFSYTGHPEWRSYFRSTPAHNTVSVNKSDQASQVSAFMWKEGGVARFIEGGDFGDKDRYCYALASFDWLEPDSCSHYRACIYDNMSGYWIIWDYIVSENSVDTDLHWHLEGESVSLDGLAVSFSGAVAGTLVVESPHLVEAALYHGSETPRLGWRSVVYGKKSPIYTVRYSQRQATRHEYTTVIQCEKATESYTLSGDLAEMIERFKGRYSSVQI